MRSDLIVETETRASRMVGNDVRVIREIMVSWKVSAIAGPVATREPTFLDCDLTSYLSRQMFVVEPIRLLCSDVASRPILTKTLSVLYF